PPRSSPYAIPPLPANRLSRITVSWLNPPHTPQIAFSSSRFCARMFPKLNVISHPCAGAYDRSFRRKMLSLHPSRVRSCSRRAYSPPPSASSPPTPKTASPPCVALFSTITFRLHCSKNRIPAESCPRLYVPSECPRTQKSNAFRLIRLSEL